MILLFSEVKKHENYEFFKSSNLTIEMEDGIDWSLDGEKYKGSAKTEIKVLKSAVKLKL